MNEAKPRVAAVLLMLWCAVGNPSSANARDLAVGFGAGTGGASLSVSQPVDDNTALRFSYGTFAVSRASEFDNVVIDVLTKLRLNERFRVGSAGLFVDRRLHGALHVSLGAVLNENHISAVSVPAESSLVIDHYVYSAAAAGEIFTDVKWMPVSPYVGFGFGPRYHERRRVSFVAELGAYYEGRANVTFDANGAIRANQANFSKYFDTLKRQLSTELSPVEIYPIVQIGVRLRM